MPHLTVTLRDQEVDLSRQDLDGLRGRLPRSLTSVETQAVLGHHPASEIERVALAEQSTLSPSPATAGAGCHGCCWAVLLPNWCNEQRPHGWSSDRHASAFPSAAPDAKRGLSPHGNEHISHKRGTGRHDQGQTRL
jgi:hypothetical protein